MTRLEEALGRLERAVARLEAARGIARGEGEPPDARRSAASEAENLRLHEIAGEIAARVDSALARAGQVLGEEG